MFNYNLLKEILSIPTYYDMEYLLIDYLKFYAKIKNYIFIQDNVNNVFLIKGKIDEKKFYPCVVAHLDTVHLNNIYLIEQNKRIPIIEKKNNENLILTTNGDYGIGGDDKAGVFVALSIMENFNNIIGAFFVKEEFGCFGSKNLEYEELLKSVGYFIQFDAPTGDWFSWSSNGIVLYNDSTYNLVEPILDKYDIKRKKSIDPYTDVYILRQKFKIASFNMFCGYYKAHTSKEYVSVSDVNKSIMMGSEIIKLLGNNYKII